MSKKMVRLSAEEAVKHASSLLEMADAFLSAKADPARLPSVAGFAMFIACVIQFKSLGAQRKLQVAGTSSFTASICVLSSVKLYWTSLREMVCRISVPRVIDLLFRFNSNFALESLCYVETTYIISGNP
jgi:hypothetical protein